MLSATTGEEGVEIASRELPYDSILDVQVPPGISGTEACCTLKANPDTAEILMIFLTGKVDLDEVEETLEDNTQGYILKPFSVYDLLVKIDDILSPGLAA